MFRATVSGCSCYRIEMVGKDLGTLSQTLLKNFLKEVFKNFKNFKQGDFRSLLFVCADFGVAVFRAAISGCSEVNPVKRDWHSCRFSPLPDRNGRKLVDDGTPSSVAYQTSAIAALFATTLQACKPANAVFRSRWERKEGKKEE